MAENTTTARVRPTRELRDKLRQAGKAYGLGPRSMLLKAVRRALAEAYVPEPLPQSEPRVSMRLPLTREEKRRLRDLAKKASRKPEAWILEVAKSIDRFVKPSAGDGG